MGHAFFEATRWDAMHEETPPFVPSLRSDDDTCYFQQADGYKQQHSCMDGNTDDSVANNFDDDDDALFVSDAQKSLATAEDSFVGGVHVEQLIGRTLDSAPAARRRYSS